MHDLPCDRSGRRRKALLSYRCTGYRDGYGDMAVSVAATRRSALSDRSIEEMIHGDVRNGCISMYLPVSPCISVHLHANPCISPASPCTRVSCDPNTTMQVPHLTTPHLRPPLRLHSKPQGLPPAPSPCGRARCPSLAHPGGGLAARRSHPARWRSTLSTITSRRGRASSLLSPGGTSPRPCQRAE